MPVTRVPIRSLTQPPTKFNSLEEANAYLIELHRDLENLITSIDSVISLNYEDIDGGSA